MIAINNDDLTFTFPETAAQIRELFEKLVRSTLRKLVLPLDRGELVEALESYLHRHSSKWQLRPPSIDFSRSETVTQSDRNRTSRLRAPRQSSHEALMETANALTPADVEAALREAAKNNECLADDFASLTIGFQRTLRIPDDGTIYPLPAGLGSFPLRSVDDYADTAPETWKKRGGVAMPIYQSEALWIRFRSRYPFAVKIGSGKINAVSGDSWKPGLQGDPQDYVVVPGQRWLDGFACGEGLIRQFLAVPLGAGFTVEEQLTGKADVGGMQIQVYPMHAESYFREEFADSIPSTLEELFPHLFAKHLVPFQNVFRNPCLPTRGMGLGAGGRMRQEIYQDSHAVTVWNQAQSKRCFVHLCNSMHWRQITGTNPPHPPLTAEEYKAAGIPWFDYYRDDLKPLKGSKRLAEIKSVATIAKESKHPALADDASIEPDLIIQYGNTRRPETIREFLDTL